MSAPLTLGEIIGAALECAVEPSLPERASRGDLEALRVMSNAAYVAATSGGEGTALAYMEAITLGRLAAAHGCIEDCRAVVYLLSTFAGFLQQSGCDTLAVHYEAQALHLAEALAIDGDDEMANMVVAAADKIPPAVYDEVRSIRERGAGTCTAL